MARHVKLFIDTETTGARAIAVLRRHTGKSVAELSAIIRRQDAVVDEQPHHNQWRDFETRLWRLLAELNHEGVRHRVEIDGKITDASGLDVLRQRWREAREDTMRQSDLESGAPSISTLEWLSEQIDVNAFRGLLEEIIGGECYDCDATTRAWAHNALKELEKAGK